MCGIFGFMGPGTDQEFREDLLRNLFYWTEDRGEDASGLAYVDPTSHSTIILKDAVKGSEFAFGPEIEGLIKEGVPPAFIGHCRKKTQGAEGDAMNNHPVYSKTTGIALIHNGTVRDEVWRAVDESGDNVYILDKFEASVDTESILRLVDTMLFIPRDDDGSIDPEVVAKTPKKDWTRNVSLTKAIDDAVYNLNGSHACSLVSPDEPDVVYVWRGTKDKPLYLYYLPELEAIVFASTKEIADKALNNETTQTWCDFFSFVTTGRSPEKIGKELLEGTLLRIEWIPAKKRKKGDHPFKIDQTVLKPGGATSTYNMSSGPKKSFEATEKGVTTH